MAKEPLGGTPQEEKVKRWDTWQYQVGVPLRDFGTFTGCYCREKYWLRLAWFFWGFESWGEYWMHGTESDFGREAKRVTIPRLTSLFR